MEVSRQARELPLFEENRDTGQQAGLAYEAEFQGLEGLIGAREEPHPSGGAWGQPGLLHESHWGTRPP